MRDVSGDQKHVLLADATSGAGGGKVSIAGSLGSDDRGREDDRRGEVERHAARLNGGDVVADGDVVGGEHGEREGQGHGRGHGRASARVRRSTSSIDVTTALIRLRRGRLGREDVTLAATRRDKLTTYAEAGAEGAAGSTLAFTANAAITLATVTTTAKLAGDTTQGLTTSGAVSGVGDADGVDVVEGGCERDRRLGGDRPGVGAGDRRRLGHGRHLTAM